MRIIIRGSEEVARNKVNAGTLRRHFRALYPDIHIPRVAVPTLYHRTLGAWLWSRERGVITGRAAAALHGAKWVDEDIPIELIWRNNHPPDGIITRNERIAAEEIVEINGMAVASLQRTAMDLGRYLRRGQAVAHLDALARATGLTAEQVLPLADNYKGARGVRRFREAIDLMDAGAQSPKETWMRLLLIDAGHPRPQTQIPVLDDYGNPFAWLDLGWEEPMIGLDYNGDHHRADRGQYVWDARRQTWVQQCGWLHRYVIAEDRPYEILDWAARAWALREAEGSVVKRSA